MIARAKSVAARSMVVFKTSKAQSHRTYDQVRTYLRPKNVGIVGKSLKERMTACRGDRHGKISRSKVDGHVQNF